MGQTVLQLVQNTCREINIAVPSALTSATDSSTLQLIQLFYAAGKDLRSALWWPQLKRSYQITLQSGRNKYQLPEDFFASIPETQWDKNNRWQMQGPLSDGIWNCRVYGWTAVLNYKAWRVFGGDTNPNSGGGQFEINPTPGDSEQGLLLTFDYISRNWIVPELWTAGTSFTANEYCYCFGNIYQKGSGTASAGTVPPNMANAIGQDGGMYWLALPTVSAWASTTVYPPGRYVTNGGNLYYCTSGGTSAGSGGPTGTDTDDTVTDGTVTWQYYAVESWTGQTDYTQGDIILISSQYYVAQNGGKSGGTQPTWTQTTVSDGTITWTYKTAAYEAIIADTDLCMFDDELMIAALKWRFLQARGLQYADLMKEYMDMKAQAVARYAPSMKFNLAGGGYSPSGLFPNVPEGSFTF